MKSLMHNIDKMVEHTFKILLCLQHIIFKSMFSHFFNFMYGIDVFEDKRSYDF